MSEVKSYENSLQSVPIDKEVFEAWETTPAPGSLSGTVPLRKAFVLAGGFGTRMKELTQDVPKPLLEVQGKPILDYSIDLCKRYGINDISLSVFHMKDKIKERYGDGKDFGVNIVYVEEPEALGTAGALRLHRAWLNEHFMMCNADELKDINLQAMMKQHIETNAIATVALTEVEDPSQYGVVELDGDKILRFVEKPKVEEAPSRYINAGLYILSPKIVDLVPPGYAMIEKDIFPKLAASRMLYGFKFKGQWVDTGTVEKYHASQSLWKGFKESASK
jgi:mannose-1-phosphate guanylyltransferase